MLAMVNLRNELVDELEYEPYTFEDVYGEASVVGEESIIPGQDKGFEGAYNDYIKKLSKKANIHILDESVFTVENANEDGPEVN
jgi:hypothetical protein